MCVCMHVCMYACVYVRMYVLMYVCICVCMYLCMYVFVYVCMYVYQTVCCCIITITATKRHIKIYRIIISVTLHGDPRHHLHTHLNNRFTNQGRFSYSSCWIHRSFRAVRWGMGIWFCDEHASSRMQVL